MPLPPPKGQSLAEMELNAQFAEMTRAAGLEEIAAACGNPIKSHLDTCLDLIISVDKKIEDIKHRIRKFAPHNIPILILGETGVGKELIARALHGNRKPDSFVPLNCGAIPADLLESELFGAVKGAYTGSVSNRVGLIEKARSGTLFLDEIGDMPPLLQCKLLRVLEDKRYRKVGDTTETAIDFRFISATNHMDLSTKENFRLDLYYRLAGHVIHVPPLRERSTQDINLIVTSLAKNMTVMEEVFARIKDNTLRGNIRELRNIIEECNILY